MGYRNPSGYTIRFYCVVYTYIDWEVTGYVKAIAPTCIILVSGTTYHVAIYDIVPLSFIIAIYLMLMARRLQQHEITRGASMSQKFIIEQTMSKLVPQIVRASNRICICGEPITSVDTVCDTCNGKLRNSRY